MLTADMSVGDSVVRSTFCSMGLNNKKKHVKVSVSIGHIFKVFIKLTAMTIDSFGSLKKAIKEQVTVD